MKINSIRRLESACFVPTNKDKISNQQYISSLKNEPSVDTVNFKSINKIRKPILTSLTTAKSIARNLTASTAGHRAPYMSEQFNPNITKLITIGIADYVKNILINNTNIRPRILIGGDNKKSTAELLPIIADTLCKQGIDVITAKNPSPTPLLALATRNSNFDFGIAITASHNNYHDTGYNILTGDGVLAPARVTSVIAEYMIEHAKSGYFDENRKNIGTNIVSDIKWLYKTGIKDLKLINWENIKTSGLKVYYDSMNGVGSDITTEFLKEHKIPYKEISSSQFTGQNPIPQNLNKLIEEVKNSDSKLKIGFAHDIDASRVGVIDENGNYIDADDILLLTAYHMAKNKRKNGVIIKSQGTSQQLDYFANKYGQKLIETPIGFKYISENILDLRYACKDILVAGEESGGLTVNGYMPEKDGILASMLIMDLIATENKPISEILAYVKSTLGKEFARDNFSLKFSNDAEKNAITDKFKTVYNNALRRINNFGENHTIDVTKTAEHQKLMWKYRLGGDGIKLILDDGSTVLVRKSGTESLVKFYIEATGNTSEAAEANKKRLKEHVYKIIQE